MTVTAVEFLAKLPAPKSRQDLVLAALFYEHRHAGVAAVSVGNLRSFLVGARVPGAAKINLADVLGKSGALAHASGKNAAGHMMWSLTDTGDKHIRKLLDIPDQDVQLVNQAAELDLLATTISDDNVRHYVEEAILCLRANARRAAIVFMWVAAVQEIQDRVWAASTPAAISAAAHVHSPKAKTVVKRDDMVELNEALLLQVAQDVGVLDKNEKQVLDGCLQTRNSSGHPNKLRPGVAKVTAHIEDIVGILFS